VERVHMDEGGSADVRNHRLMSAMPLRAADKQTWREGRNVPKPAVSRGSKRRDFSPGEGRGGSRGTGSAQAAGQAIGAHSRSGGKIQGGAPWGPPPDVPWSSVPRGSTWWDAAYAHVGNLIAFAFAGQQGFKFNREEAMRINAFAALTLASTLAAGTAAAQPAPFNEVGVTMGHWHIISKDVEANKKIFAAMGGKLFMLNGPVMMFPGV